MNSPSKLLAALSLVLAATTWAYAADSPLVDISLQDSLFVPGKQLGLRVTIQAGTAAGTRVDGYIGVQLPDGSLLFLVPDLNDPKQTPQVFAAPVPAVTNFPLADFSGIILDLPLPILPSGNYTLFAFGVTPGANPLAESAPATSEALTQDGVGSVIAHLLTKFAVDKLATNIATAVAGYFDGPQLVPVFEELVAAGSTPLILIHGFQLPGFEGPERTWNTFLSKLFSLPLTDPLYSGGKLRVRPFFFDYRTLATLVLGRSIERLAELLKMQLDRRQIDGPIMILAHSTGGLVARSFMQDTFSSNGLQSGERVLRLIALATPHHGTPLTLVSDAIDILIGVMDPTPFKAASLALHAIFNDDFIHDLSWDCNDVVSWEPSLFLVAPDFVCGSSIGLPFVSVRENKWLRCLNHIECSDTSRLTRKMFLDKIVAYGGSNNQGNDVFSTFMRSLAELGVRTWRFDDNDGVVPIESALFLPKILGRPSGLTRREGVRHLEIHEDSALLQDILMDIKAALPPLPANQPPTITSLSATSTYVLPGGTSRISVSVSDPENDPLTYTWSATCGTLSATSGPGPVTWTAPGNLITCTIIVNVKDEPGRSVTKSVDIRVEPAPPSFLPAPTLLTLTNGATGVSTTPTFTWSAVAGAIGYRILIATNAGTLPSDPTTGICGGCIHNATTVAGVASYTPGAGILNGGTTYYWKVHALGSTSFGTWSGVFSFTTQAGPLPPAPPSNLIATALSVSQVGLTWVDNSTDETGFKIERKTGTGGTFAQIATQVPNVTGFLDSGLAASTQYCYRVRATNAGGDSAYSNEACATTQAGPPSLPGAFSLNVFGECSGNNPAIRLSWSPSSNATSYEVHRNGVLLVGALSSSTESHVDTTVVAGVSYSYFIRARNASGFTDSNSVNLAALTNCIFTLTTQPECSGTVSQIRLRWSVPPTGASSYEVFRNGVSIFSTVNSNLTEYVNTGVSPGVTYDYFVRASTSAGLRDSTNAAATALSCGTSPPGQFTLSASLECSNGVPQIRLNWTSSVGVDFYQILRNGSVLQGVSGNVTTFLDTAVTAGTTYNYIVRAINSGGQTDSNAVSVTPSCITPPGAFTLTVTPWCSGNAPVNLVEWTASVGRTFPYEVYRNGSLVFTTDFGQYEDTAVAAGTSYTYFVRAKNSVGSRDSNTVTGTTKTDCGAPVAPVITSISPQLVTVGDGGFTLTLTGSNFDSTAKILWGFSGGQPPGNLITPTFVNSSTLTVQVTQNTGGFSPFSIPGVLAIQVLKPGPNFWDGQRSNTVQFTLFNPVPVIDSISGTCRANLNCTPSIGFDVRIFGSGFVNNSAFVGGTFVSSTTLDINGAAANMNLMGQGPAYTQMQLLANGSLIPTPGTYTLRVCNAGTSQGTACSTGSLTVTP